MSALYLEQPMAQRPSVGGMATQNGGGRSDPPYRAFHVLSAGV